MYTKQTPQFKKKKIYFFFLYQQNIKFWNHGNLDDFCSPFFVCKYISTDKSRQIYISWYNLSIYLFIYLSIYLSFCLSIFSYIFSFIFSSIYIYIDQSIYLSIYLSICKTVYFSIYLPRNRFKVRYLIQSVSTCWI